ncbi:transposase [Microbacterium sp. C5A9]|uniref:transposase n=1 Tax=Microbacterium sp. C5A9 TaxID=2736663 RepID=UPI001F520511|nr:transposase [Microbacterium sp. C5A9]MCI1017867.1 transposase [Microbacterium sp. C5A9]
MTRGASLVEIASELYTGALDEFITARNARAGATAARDPALAAQIRELRKPSVAAWVVNIFASERREQLAEALELAEQLREAQDDLDASALSRLGRDRRALTVRLAAAAAELAEARGERVTTATREAVQQTLSAAFFDADAAAAVSSGRLVRALEPRGAFSDAMESIVGGGAPGAPARQEKPVDELDARRRRREAERLLRDAQQAHDRSAARAAAASRELREITRTAEALSSRAASLEKELAAVRREQELTRDAVELSEKEQQEASEQLAAADDVLNRAESAVGLLD